VKEEERPEKYTLGILCSHAIIQSVICTVNPQVPGSSPGRGPKDM
jgi:hypothetical protein